jgi:hypothetical protein
MNSRKSKPEANPWSEAPQANPEPAAQWSESPPPRYTAYLAETLAGELVEIW